MDKRRDACNKKIWVMSFMIGLTFGILGYQIASQDVVLSMPSCELIPVVNCDDSFPVSKSKVITLNSGSTYSKVKDSEEFEQSSVQFANFKRYGLTPVYATEFQKYIISELSKGNTNIDLTGRYNKWDPYKMFAEINDVSKVNPWFGYIKTCEFNFNKKSVKVIFRSSRVPYSEMLSEASKKADEIISSVITNDMSKRDKVLAVADYIAQTTVYDDKAAASVTARSRDIIPSQYLPSFNAYGSLIEGKCCCVGYANTLQMFLNKLGIPSIVEWGYLNGFGEHMWTTINLDGAWYCLDITGYSPKKKGSALIYDKTVNKSTRLLYNLDDYKVSL